MQSIAAFANTSVLSVLRNTSNTSRTAATCLRLASVTSSPDAVVIRTARRAPNNARHPDLISFVHASTSSQMEHTICVNHKVGFSISNLCHSYRCIRTNIGIFKMFLRWVLDIFNAQIQGDIDSGFTLTMHEIKDEDLLAHFMQI